MMPEKNRFPCIVQPVSFPQNLSATQEVGEADVSVTLQAKNPTAVAFSCKDSGQDASDDVAPTLRSMGHDDSHPNGGGQIAVAFSPKDGLNAHGSLAGSTELALPLKASDHKDMQAIAFKAAHYTRGKDGAPSETAFALSADADMGDQDNLVLAPFVGDVAPTMQAGGNETGGVRPYGTTADTCESLVAEPVAFDETQLTHPANHSSPKPGDPCHPLAAGARPPAIAFAFQTRIARNDRGQPEDICPTLNGADAGETSDSRPVVAMQSKSFTVSQNSNGFGWIDDVAPTVQTQQPNPEANTFSGVTDGWAVRRLTPRECERLQGFPDDWTLIPYGSKTAISDDRLEYLRHTYPEITREEAEQLAADAPRYKAIGNSMAVNVMRWIGMRIDFVDKLVGGAPE